MPRGSVDLAQVRVAEVEVTAETVMVPGSVGGVPDAPASGWCTTPMPVMTTMTTITPMNFRTLNHPAPCTTTCHGKPCPRATVWVQGSTGNLVGATLPLRRETATDGEIRARLPTEVHWLGLEQPARRDVFFGPTRWPGQGVPRGSGVRHGHDRLVQGDPTGRPVELGRPEAEDAAVGGDEPVARSVRRRRHADDRLSEVDSTGGAEERCATE